MANGWGLLLIVLFLGHGLVEVPRDLWRTADYHAHLRSLQYRAPGMKEAASDAEIEFYDVANDVAAASRRVAPGDPLRPFVDRLMEKCPESMDRNLGMNGAVPSGGITKAHLVSLHLRLKAAERARDRREAQWQNLLHEAFFLEDLVESERNPERMLITAASRLGEVPRWRMSLGWWWQIRFKPLLQRALAIACGLLSLALIWSEMTFQIQKPMLTILGLLFHLEGITYEAIEAMSIVAITYMCACAYSSLFKVRWFDIYALVPNHHTDEGSLLFVAAYLWWANMWRRIVAGLANSALILASTLFTNFFCKLWPFTHRSRLTFPLCYNFLNLLTDQDDTMFVAIMGKVDLVPLLGGFQVYVPLMIGIICLVTFFHFHSRLLAACGVGDFFSGNEDADGPIVLEGKSYIDQARAAEERIRRNVGGGGGRDTDRLLVSVRDKALNWLVQELTGAASSKTRKRDA